MAPADAPTAAQLDEASAIVYETMTPTPQQRWPLLDRRCGAAVWVKHENHTPVGAFKVRGGLVYVDWLRRRVPRHPRHRRGDARQSRSVGGVRRGASRAPCCVVVPGGNSPEKNRAMRALGAELIESGHDFQAALEAAAVIARDRGWHFMPSFHPMLVRGVASYSLELLRAVPDLQTLYVPIGLGSGICGAIAVRDALGLATDIVGVVSDAAPAYARSLEAGHAGVVRGDDEDRGWRRVPDARRGGARHDPEGVERVVEVSDDEVEAAMRALFDDTHNVAEGAAAAGLAALLRERGRSAGQSVGVVLTGANVDADQFARVLSATEAP